MAKAVYKALTWDHPRGYNALAAASAALPAEGILAIDWHKQPLEGFESHPIADLCARYDLVVLDHPHVGEAVADDCLVALETVLPEDFLEALDQGCVGASLRSYVYEGHLWALPLDAATQVAAMRADLMDGPAPKNWDEVRKLATNGKVALSIAGPHALLSFGSICVALGEKPGTKAAGQYISDTVGAEALDILYGLYATMPAESRALNPIGLLGLMAQSDAVAYCPLVYGYVNYAAPDDENAHRVAFADAPAGRGGIGSTLGGTGLAISKKAAITPQLIEHMIWLLSEQVQVGFIPGHDGQPSLRKAWHDDGVNEQWGDFYRNTVATLEAAWVRPRFNGYIAFQTAASALLRDAMAEKRDYTATLAALNTLYQDHRPANSTL